MHAHLPQPVAYTPYSRLACVSEIVASEHTLYRIHSNTPIVLDRTGLEHCIGFTLLGKSTAGEVYKAVSKETEDVIVLKIVSCKGNSADRERARKEADTLWQVTSPYVVPCHEAVFRKTDVVIVTGYCDGGTLQGFVQEYPAFFAEHRDIFLRAAKQMLTGLLALHEKALVHRDIKPENVFMVSDEGAPKEFPYRMVLGDPGLARQLDGASQVAVSAVGTDMYKPPEHLTDLCYSQLGDIW